MIVCQFMTAFPLASLIYYRYVDVFVWVRSSISCRELVVAECVSSIEGMALWGRHGFVGKAWLCGEQRVDA